MKTLSDFSSRTSRPHGGWDALRRATKVSAALVGVLGLVGCTPEQQAQLEQETLSSSRLGLTQGGSSLLHRYSFTTDASDSVSHANATLTGGASVANGVVTLDGVSGYVSLPIGGTIASLQDATFEAWVNWDSSSGQTWARIFDFNDGVWNKTLFLTPRNGRFDSGPATDTPRFAITQQAMGGEEQANSASGFPVGALTHVAVTMDSVARVNRLYINGVQVAQKQSTTLTPASLGLLPNHWLGRSLYPADPFFKGSFSEFRVYGAALSPSRIAAHTSAGPDQLEEAPTACNSGEPRLVLNGPSTLTLECGSSPYSELGAQAFDGCGNPIPVHAYNTGTDSSGPGPNTSNEGSYSVSYAAWDAMGHTVSALRTVNVEDRTAPALQLLGPAFMTHTCGSQWVDPGVQAADACYGNVSAQVQRTGEVNGWVPGTYTVTYSLTDSGGNSAMPVTRTVQVANCPW